MTGRASSSSSAMHDDPRLVAANRRLGWILFGIFAALAAVAVAIVLVRAAGRS